MPSEISAGSDHPVVIDASVWISAVLEQDRFHALSRAWLDRQRRPVFGVLLPALALAEIGGAIGRISDDKVRARAVVRRVQRLRSVHIHALDYDLAVAATNLAIDLRIRGADAVYVALAARLTLPLVTWDQELLERAAGRIEVRTPEPG